MLNGDGNENGKNSNFSYQQKKKIASAARFFVHLFDVVLLDDNVKRPSYTSYIGNGVCAHQNCCWLCPCSLFFFSLSLIFTLLAASISHFLTANFHVLIRLPLFCI